MARAPRLCVALTTPCLSMGQVICSAHCVNKAFIIHRQWSTWWYIKGSLQMSVETLVSILHFKEYKDYLGTLPRTGTHFSGFLVSAILHLNMASGFLLTENHTASRVTRKGWGGVFLWVSEKYCLRNGNTALIVIQPLFLLLFSVKYNKNIVGNNSQLSAVEGNTPSIRKASGAGSAEFQPCLVFHCETDCGWKTAEVQI